MSRDSTGNYTSPSGPFVSGTIINSSVMNQKLTDLGDEITNSLDRNGKGDMLAPILVPDGTNNLPGYGFSSEATLGFWRAATGQINATSNGTALQKWSTTEVRVYNAFKVSAGGAVIDAGGLTVTAGGLEVVAGGAVVTAGGLTVTAGNTSLGGGVTGPALGPLVVTNGLRVATENTALDGGVSGPSGGTLVVANGLSVTVGGLAATGATTGDGGTFYGGATSGSGVVAYSTGGSTAVVGTGAGTNAKGAQFTATGNAAGVTATGGSSGHGMVANGGGTGGYGIVGTGGPNTAGVVAQSGTAATGATAQAALTCANGYLTFGSTAAPNSGVALSNTLTPANICKAWADISISGTTPTLDDGFNIASVAENVGTLVITFAQAFSSGDYSCTVTPSGSLYAAGPASTALPFVISKAAGSVIIEWQNLTNGTARAMNFTTSINVQCVGRQ